jgi:hypothetical protein
MLLEMVQRWCHGSNVRATLALNRGLSQWTTVVSDGISSRLGRQLDST